MEYKFSGLINIDDYMQWRQFNFFTSLKAPFTKTKFFGILLILLAYFLYSWRKGNILQTITVLTLILAAIGSAILIMYYSKALHIKSFSKDASNTDECEYTINKNYINIRHGDSLIHLEKNNIHKILADKDSLYIYLSPANAKIIKKRFFAREDEYKSLLSFISNEYI